VAAAAAAAAAVYTTGWDARDGVTLTRLATSPLTGQWTSSIGAVAGRDRAV